MLLAIISYSKTLVYAFSSIFSNFLIFEAKTRFFSESDNKSVTNKNEINETPCVKLFSSNQFVHAAVRVSWLPLADLKLRGRKETSGNEEDDYEDSAAASNKDSFSLIFALVTFTIYLYHHPQLRTLHPAWRAAPTVPLSSDPSFDRHPSTICKST